MVIKPFLDNCAGCNNKFLKKDKRIRFCSLSCANRSNPYTFKVGNKINLGRVQSEGTREKIRTTLLASGHMPPAGIRARGEHHWNWRGGVTSFYRKIKNSRAWKIWRIAVFERDNYTCKGCGSRSGDSVRVELEPHHLFSVTKLIRAGLEKHIFNLNNGLTLCLACHQRTKARNWGINYES